MSTKSAAPCLALGCIYPSLSLSPFFTFFLTPSLPLCASLKEREEKCISNIKSLSYASLSLFASIIQHLSPLEVKVQHLHTWLKTSACHLKHPPGRGLHKMPRPSIHDKRCQSKLSPHARQHCGVNQQSPERVVKNGNLFSGDIPTYELKCAFIHLPSSPSRRRNHIKWALIIVEEESD